MNASTQQAVGEKMMRAGPVSLVEVGFVHVLRIIVPNSDDLDCYDSLGALPHGQRIDEVVECSCLLRFFF